MDFIAKSLISNKTLAINMICFVHSVHLAKWLRPSEYFYCYIVDYHVKTSCFLDFDAKSFWYMINLKMSHILSCDYLYIKHFTCIIYIIG